MGSIGEGLTPKQNWASVRMAKASNRHCLATATSLQPYTLSLQSHGIRAGEGQAGSQINISRDVHFSFCSLVLIIPLTTTVSFLDTKSTSLACPARPSSSGHRSISESAGSESHLHHTTCSPKKKCLFSRMMIFQMIFTQHRGPRKSCEAVSDPLCQSSFR